MKVRNFEFEEIKDFIGEFYDGEIFPQLIYLKITNKGECSFETTELLGGSSSDYFNGYEVHIPLPTYALCKIQAERILLKLNPEITKLIDSYIECINEIGTWDENLISDISHKLTNFEYELSWYGDNETIEDQE